MYFRHGAVPVKEYDWYGAYGNLRHTEYGYKERLNLDYTFKHPEIHDNVSISKSISISDRPLGDNL